MNKIVSNPDLHARFLNTLSLMENTGARKIMQCEHPRFVKEVILKHAAEEARHAYFLKKQIAKVNTAGLADYSPIYTLGGFESAGYLKKLDVAACKMLKSDYNITGEELKYAAYLLVTWAIEVRADALYPVYQKCLDLHASKVNVKSIIAEEEGHLQEMNEQLQSFHPAWEEMCQKIARVEDQLFQGWVNALSQEVSQN